MSYTYTLFRIRWICAECGKHFTAGSYAWFGQNPGSGTTEKLCECCKTDEHHVVGTQRY